MNRSVLTRFTPIHGVGEGWGAEKNLVSFDAGLAYVTTLVYSDRL